jgi:glycosyltransferase involved in cell wall biosynthesis
MAIGIQRNPTARGLMVGRGVESASDISQLVKRLGRDRQIIRVGYTERPENYLSAADLACSSSVTEGFPNAVVEALLCSLPCVVTDVGMSSELVAGDGIVVPTSNPAALAQGLETLVRASAQHREELGKRARDRVGHEFSLQHALSKWVTVYNEVLQQERAV